MATKYTKLHDESPEAPGGEELPASQQPAPQQPVPQQPDTSGGNWNQQPAPYPAVQPAPYPAVQPAPYPAVQPAPQHWQQQQQSSNTTVVLGQPAPAPLSVVAPQPPPPPKPYILVLTIVFSVVFTFLGAWPAWLCLYPSVIFAIVGYSLFDSHRDDQRKTASVFNSLAVGFLVAGIVTFVILVIVVIILWAITPTSY